MEKDLNKGLTNEQVEESRKIDKERVLKGLTDAEVIKNQDKNL